MRKLFFILIFGFLGFTVSAQVTRLKLKQLELAPDTTYRYVIVGDTVTKTAYWAKLDSLGLGGGGGSSTFYLKGDNGSVQTLSAGDTIEILSGTGLTTYTISPDQVLLTLDSTGVTAGTYNFASVTVNAQGRITLISGGTEIDGSITNEGMLGVAAGGANDATLYTNTSGNIGTSVAGSWGMLVSETTSANGGTVTLRVDSSQVATQYDISGFISGSGTSGRVPVFTGTQTIGNGTLRDDGTLLAIGGATVSGYSFYDYGTGGWRLPVGTTAQRPTPQAGALRYNSTLGYSETYGSAWLQSDFPAGTSTYTLRHNGTSWIASSNLINTGTDVKFIGSSNRFYFFPNDFTDGVTMNGQFSLLNNAESAAARLSIASSQLWLRVLGGLGTTHRGVLIAANGNSVTTKINTLLTLNHNSAATLLSLEESGQALGEFKIPVTGNGLLTIKSQSTSGDRGFNIYHHQNSTAGAAAFFFRSRGTIASPTTLQTGDVIAGIGFRPYDGTNYTLDNCAFGGAITGTVTAGSTPASLYFISGAVTSYLPDFLVHSNGNIGIGSSGTGDVTSVIIAPPRQLTVYGEARITDLTTDTPTDIVGADADGDLARITVGSGLSLSAGTLSATGGTMSSWTLAGTSGTPQAVADGQTATIAAGFGLASVAGATRTVTVAADTSKLATLYDLTQVATIYNADGSINDQRLIDLDYTAGSFNLFWDNGAGDTREFTLGDGASTYTTQDGLWFADYAGTAAGEMQVTSAQTYFANAVGATTSSITVTASSVTMATATSSKSLGATGAENWDFGSGTKITMLNPGKLGINDTSPEELLDVGGVTKTRQLVGQDNTPSMGTNANAGTGRSASITTSHSSDLAGRISLTTGTGLTAGEWFTITWAVAYSNPPAVMLMPEDANAASLAGLLYVVPTTTGVSIAVNTTSASYESKTYTYNYIVVGGK